MSLLSGEVQVSVSRERSKRKRQRTAKDPQLEKVMIDWFYQKRSDWGQSFKAKPRPSMR
ncbi:hypothetical protein DPMN_092596 [Dreissena polymorpha]|uniref:Uncharacterized protein n=1 Tax=Dreissena polymorpha TaxID=45954 RepID=A0A9D4L1N0_DREPO|nr:hypothetical protein DPMN_092596 [Dreissena polymorpha]